VSMMSVPEVDALITNFGCRITLLRLSIEEQSAMLAKAMQDVAKIIREEEAEMLPPCQPPR
jgi:hypothetical protein